MNVAAAAALCLVLAFGISALSGKVVVPWLRRLKFGQSILEEAPESHKKKAGTPTMGGIMFIAATVIALIIGVVTDRLAGGDITAEGGMVAANLRTKLWSGLVMALCFGAIGFFDDYIKVVKKRNLGLTIPQKSVAQLIVMGGYLASLHMAGATYMFIPFKGNVDLGWFFWPFGFIVLYATVNSVNFTDGLDGLCASVTSTFCAAAIGFTVLRGFFGVSLFASALLGALLGFLIWNKNPAKVFMGDTGSMFLGGAVVAISYAADMPWIILLCGIVYVIEFLSDVLQIGYFKATHGKRIFRMAPIHHHFELGGWSEKKIVIVFSAVNLLGCAAALLLVYFGRV